MFLYGSHKKLSTLAKEGMTGRDKRTSLYSFRSLQYILVYIQLYILGVYTVYTGEYILVVYTVYTGEVYTRCIYYVYILGVYTVYTGEVYTKIYLQDKSSL